jgi:hypothetical protein
VARGVYVVRTRAVSAEREPELDEWYDRTHIPEVLAIPGFVSARRFRRVGAEGTEILAIYEIDADDLSAPLAELRRRSKAGETTPTTALQLDPPPVVGLYEQVDG